MLDLERRNNNCQRYGHYFHCKEPHSISFKNCLRYVFDKKLLALKTKEHLTFSEAHARLNLIFSDLNKTTSSDSTLQLPSDTFRHRTSTPADKQQHSHFFRQPKASSPNLPPASTVPQKIIPPPDQYPTSPAATSRTSQPVLQNNPSTSQQYSSSTKFKPSPRTVPLSSQLQSSTSDCLTHVPNIPPPQDMFNICSDSITSFKNGDGLGSSKPPLQTGDNSQQPDQHKKARRPRCSEGDSTARVSSAVDDPGAMV